MNSIPIRVALVNGVPAGGQTYLNYLKHSLNHFPNGCSVSAYQAPDVGLTKEESEAILGMEVKVVDDPAFYSTWTSKDFDVVVSNHSILGGRFHDSIFCICMSHGTAPMPMNNRFFFAGSTMFWDALVVASKTWLAMSVTGIKEARFKLNERLWSLSSHIVRSPLRDTFLYPSSPIKLEIRETPPVYSGHGCVIGFLPTAVSSVVPGGSLYDSINALVELIHAAMPDARMIFRPYPADMAERVVIDSITKLTRYKFVEIDLSNENSSAFYDRVDVLVTDASTGAGSFVVKKCSPAIYYIPEAVRIGHMPVEWFCQSMRDKFMITHQPTDVVEAILKCRHMPPRERFAAYQTYCAKELWPKIDKHELWEYLLHPEKRMQGNFMHIDAMAKIVRSLDS